MKKTTKTIAAILGLLAVAGCQKENTTNLDTSFSSTETVMYYQTGSTSGYVAISSDTAWDLFLEQMLALAREGYQVSFSSSQLAQEHATKDIVTFSTTNKDEAKAWSKQMANDGYTVTINYDTKTGVYTCTAVK